MLYFDPVALCSVYNNTATIGMDISFTFHYETQNSYNIHLLRGSSILSEPDGYFIGARNCNVTLDVQEGYLTQIDSDLYVSPDGDDANTDLSADSPFKSIVYAMQRIASNPANPKTIHLAEGIYSNSNNSQLFPAGVKSHIRVIGAGIDDTIMDGEFLRTAWGAWYATDIEIANMKIVNCRSSYTFPLGVYYGSDIYLHDLKFENNWGTGFSGMAIGYSNNVIIENIIAGYTIYDSGLLTIKGFQCDGMLINNFVSADNTITDWERNDMGMNFGSCDLVLRNSIIANNTAQDAWPFFYTNIYPGFEDFNLDMSNVLIINNTMYDCWWVDNPIYMQNRFQRMQINNCTFANNNTNATLTSVIGGADIRNLVSYNPETPYELYILNYISTAAGVFIEFTLPKKPEAHPVLDIFNILGQKVKTIRLTESYNNLMHKAGLSNDVKQNGEFYSTVLNGKDDNNRPLASGTYIVRVMADQMVATTKITIIK